MTIFLTYSNPLPEPNTYFNSARDEGLTQVGLYGGAIIGILTLILVFKSFSKSWLLQQLASL